MSSDLSQVDQRPALPKLLAFGLQHVLVMYANAIAIPLVVGGALHLPKETLAYLIEADLFACGIATLIQTLGLGPFGIRLPLIMGVSAVAISPLLTIAAMPGIGLSDLFGAVIVSGIFALLIVPIMARILPLFPPVVTGSILTMIGIALMRVAVNWIGGGAAAADFGALHYLAVAGFVLAVTLVALRFGKGFVSNIAVLIGILAGYALSAVLGQTNLSGLNAAPAFRLSLPFQFGLPHFQLVPCVMLCLVMVIVFVEATGMFLALGEIVGKEITPRDIKRGLRADALGTLIGGVFNTFPYLSYSQNIGLVTLTKIHSRWVCATAGGIMLVLGLFPRIGYLAASIPLPVLGGAAIVMFGMVAAIGIRLLSKIDYAKRQHDSVIIAVALGLGILPILSPKLAHAFPAALAPIFSDPIMLCSVTAIFLNLVLNFRTIFKPQS